MGVEQSSIPVTKIDVSEIGSTWMRLILIVYVQIMTLNILNALSVRSCLAGPLETELYEIQSGPVS